MASQIVKTEKIVSGGDCLAKIDGRAVFIPFALPDEKLEIEITQEFRDYSTARILSIKEPSPHRAEAFCPLYGKCGGCTMQHCDDEYQLQLRTAVLRDAFEREGVALPPVIEQIATDPRAYRARFQFHNGGLMARKTNEVVALDSCPCATAEINKYLAEIPFSERPGGRVHVFGSDRILSIPDGYDKLVIVQPAPPPRPPKKTGKKQKQVKKRFAGTSPIAPGLCTVSLGGKAITFDVQGFFQSNIGVLEKTIPAITEGLSGKLALDMYAGAGTFSVFLADSFERLCLVEHNRDALVYAGQNLAGKSYDSFGLSGEAWVSQHAESYVREHGAFDAVVIDPPRSGMEKAVCRWLCSSGIPQIRSLSCDIATQARDAAFLCRAGYKIERLFLLDFYPQTCHIESLAWFTK
mgnify:CR=1 FL=1